MNILASSVPYVVEEGGSHDIVMLCNVPVHAKNSISKGKKKKHLAERIGNDKNRNWLFSEKTISSEKKKKSERIIRSYGCYGVIEMIFISKKAFPTVVYSIIERN